MSKLKVLHINTERTLRGGEIQTLLLISQLRARGHENTLVAQINSPLQARAISKSIQTESLTMRGELDLLAAWKLRGIIDGMSPDLLHAHTSHAVSLALLARTAKIPVVASRRVLFPLKSKRKFQKVDAILAVSQSVKNQLLKDGLSENKIFVAESATDFSVLDKALTRSEARSALSIPESAFVIGNVSFFDKHKGQSVLIEAFAEFCGGMDARNCYLLLVGDGPLFEECRQLAETLEISQRVVFTGERYDVANLYAAMNAVFLSSIHPAGEGWSGTLREAMGFGLPVIAVRLPGIEEQVRHEQTGILVSTEKEEWIAAMKRLSMDTELRNRIAEAGKKEARRFTVEALADKTETCYRAVIKSSQIRSNQ